MKQVIILFGVLIYLGTINTAKGETAFQKSVSMYYIQGLAPELTATRTKAIEKLLSTLTPTLEFRLKNTAVEKNDKEKEILGLVKTYELKEENFFLCFEQIFLIKENEVSVINEIQKETKTDSNNNIISAILGESDRPTIKKIENDSSDSQKQLSRDGKIYRIIKEKPKLVRLSARTAMDGKILDFYDKSDNYNLDGVINSNDDFWLGGKYFLTCFRYQKQYIYSWATHSLMDMEKHPEYMDDYYRAIARAQIRFYQEVLKKLK